MKENEKTEMKFTENVRIIDHPLLKHKISILRDKNTGTNQFRTVVGEVAMLMGYEALRDLPTEDVDIETPVESCRSAMLAGKKPVVVPILRAGLGMVSGILSLLPAAKVGHIGMARDEVTHEAHQYYCRLPEDLGERTVIIVDPMLATGGSASDAVDLIKEKGAKRIKFLAMIAAPEGVRRFTERHADVALYIAQVDRCLNENAYICPGLGDAGDRIFGTD